MLDSQASKFDNLLPGASISILFDQKLQSGPNIRSSSAKPAPFFDHSCRQHPPLKNAVEFHEAGDENTTTIRREEKKSAISYSVLSQTQFRRKAREKFCRSLPSSILRGLPRGQLHLRQGRLNS